MDYQVLQAGSVDDLEVKVKKAIALGYRPLGGIAVEVGPKPSSGQIVVGYFQAMIKE